MTATAVRPVSSRPLDRDLPEAGIGSRLAVPAIAFAVLLASVAVAALFVLDVRGGPRVPDAVLESESANVARLAGALAVSGARNGADLRELAQRFAGRPPQALADAVTADGRQGARVVDATGRVVARSGEPVPVGAALAAGSDGAAMLVMTVAAGGGSVSALAAPPFPGGAADPAAPVWLTDGRQVIPVIPAYRPVPEVVTRAADAAATAPGGGRIAGAVGPDGTVELAAYAPLVADGSPTPSELWLVRFRTVVAEPVDRGGRGTVAGLVLLVLAAGGGFVLYVTLVRPTRMLRRAALALASGDLSHPPPALRGAEHADFAAGLEYCRSRLTGDPALDRRRRPRVPLWLGVTAVMLSVLAWSVLSVVLVPGPAEAPEQLVGPVRERAVLAAQRTEASLNQGLVDVRAAAVERDPTQLGAQLGTLLARDGRFRGFRLVNRDGATLAAYGRPVLDGPVAATDGLAIAGEDTPIPVAMAPAPDGAVLIAEFDIQRLTAVLAAPPARARVVDTGLRVVAATEGYLAFETLTDPAVRAAAAGARADGPGAVITEATVLGVAPLRAGPAGDLGWVVLVDEPVAALALPANEVRQRAALLGLLAAAVAVLVWSVYVAYHVRPWRRAAAMANRLRAGDVDSLIYSQFLGPGGTALSCLDILRRAVARGDRATLGTRRLPGAAGDEGRAP